MHKIYNMDLLERFSIDRNSNFTRVPGGWVYGDMQGCCFVPWVADFEFISTSKYDELPTTGSQQPRTEICSDIAESIMGYIRSNGILNESASPISVRKNIFDIISRKLTVSR